MRTLTAVALALSLLFTVGTANATAHKHRRHQASSKKDTSKDAGNTAAAAKPKAPATK